LGQLDYDAAASVPRDRLLLMDHLKHCPICNNDLPVDSFGICRARPSGRNLYCKDCIREKVRASRRKLKEYKATRQRVLKQQYWGELTPVPAPVLKPGKLRQSPVERIRELIRERPRTQRELRSKTKLHKDEIGEALATLLLWNHEIKSELVGDDRIYFFVEEKPIPVVPRKPMVLGSFSSLYELGPGRKRAVG
jgi:hypothetical protein